MDVNLKPEQVASKVPGMRTQFKQKHAADISKGEYDQRDLDRLEKDDAYARCFLRTLKSNGDIDKAVDVINECFKFRKEYGMWDLTDASFPDWVWERNGVYYKNHDKNNCPILYMDVKANTSTGDEIPVLKKFLAYNMEKHHRDNPEIMVVALMDMSRAGTSNMNMDVSKFLITCFATYFPAYLAYMVNYEMPMILSAVWKIIRAFMSHDQQKKTVVIGKKEITKYIDADQLPDNLVPKK